MNGREFPYRDRRHAGSVLAGQLGHYLGRAGLQVLALPRGGVAVAFEIAHALQAPLDVLIVRKLGFPGHEEYAMGAIASGGVQVLNPSSALRVAPEVLACVIARERVELERRERLYRGGQPPPQLRDSTVILVDDGLATGSTMRAAVLAVRRQQPSLLCVAVPVGAAQTCEELRAMADEVICAVMPNPFGAVGQAYEDFQQAGDAEVCTLLEAARLERSLAADTSSRLG